MVDHDADVKVPFDDANFQNRNCEVHGVLYRCSIALY